MNNVDTIDSVIKRAPRRKHSAELRARVLQACSQPGASIATIARLHGLNAVMPMQGPSSGFLAVNIIPETHTTPAPLPPPDIRVEVTRANTTIVVNWPLEGAPSCAVWLREWLR